MNRHLYRLLTTISGTIFWAATQLLAQNNVYIQINSSDGVHFIVTDPLGRRTGADPRGIPRDTTYRVTFINEIPGAGYAFSGAGSLNAGDEDTETHEFMLSDTLPQTMKNYSLLIIGTRTCDYWVDLMMTLSQGTQVRTEVHGVIQKDSAVLSGFTINDTPGSTTAISRVVNVASVLNDISIMQQLNLVVDQSTADKYTGLINTYASQIQQNNFNAARVTLTSMFQNIVADSSRGLTADGCSALRTDVEQLLNQLPSPLPGLAITLINSGGTVLTGGSLQYYEGSWKDAINNNDGTFNVNTTLTTVSLRMTYAYGSQTKSNVPINGGPVIFQTVNTQVKLQNSQAVLIDQGTAQYYAGAWRDFGTTTNGVAAKELLPASYSFRMTYAYGSNDKQQDIGNNPAVVFQTVNVAVQLKNSQGTLMDAGTVQYYAGAWRDFGSTTNGVTTKEILPTNYSFRMTYAFASKDMQQNIGTNPTVVFNTVNATVQLKNSQGNLIDQGTVQYYAGAWRSFGTTTNGTATKELLANNYSFRMTYEFVSNDKAQDIGANSTVGFSTVLCTVRVANTVGQLVSGAVVSYYSGAWRQIGSTVNGQITKELLPANLSFRASYGGRSQDKAQNLSANAVVDIVLP
jgi:adhesin HecA-like repeat protein